MPQIMSRIVHRLKRNSSRICQTRVRDPRHIFLECLFAVRRPYETISTSSMTDKICWVVKGTKANTLASYTRNDIKGAIQLIYLTSIVLMLVKFPAKMSDEMIWIILRFESKLLSDEVTFLDCHGSLRQQSKQNILIISWYVLLTL